MASRRARRILVGTVEIAGILPDLATGFRRLGCEVTTVIRQYNRFYPGYAYDIDISVAAPDIVRWPAAIARSRSTAVRLPRGAVNRLTRWGRLARLMARHDTFLFQWGGTSLTDGNREFKYLAAVGKRIISAFVGSDIRSPDAYAQQFDALSTAPDFASALVDKTLGDEYRPMKNLRTAELHSHLILSVPNQSSLSLRPYTHFFVPIDLSQYPCRVPGRDVPVVVHAPSSRGIKGSEIVEAGLAALRRDGVRFELRLLEGVPNQQVREVLQDADVVIDQLYLPLHGKLGIEAMASGCALATSNREQYEPFPPGRPIFHVDRESFVPRMRQLLSDKPARLALAHNARRYVEQYHDHVAVAERILQRLEIGGNDAADHFPKFFSQDFRMAPGQTLPAPLRRLSTAIVRRWGVPKDADLSGLVTRGLIDPPGVVPRWS